MTHAILPIAAVWLVAALAFGALAYRAVTARETRDRNGR